MMRGGDDQGLMQSTVPTGACGVESVVSFYNNATQEVKNLLTNELDVLFECRYCRNMFRSIVNLITHKRGYCRGRFESISAQVTATQFATNAIASGSASNGSEDKKRHKSSLKRLNLISAINKRTEHYALALPDSDKTMSLHTLPRISRPVPTTTFQDGEQVFETMPRSIATKEPLPPERVPLVIPQDNTYRYREMNLRLRKGETGRHDVVREVDSQEIAVMDRLCRNVSSLIELSSMVCLHSDCKDKRPFSSIFTLAYHITVKHNRRWLSNKQIPCFLCDISFNTYGTVTAHLKEDHYEYHTEHCDARAKHDADKVDQRRTRRSKCNNKACAVRYRSLSPMSEDFVETDEMINAKGDEDEHTDADKTSLMAKKGHSRDMVDIHCSEMSSPLHSLSSLNIDLEAGSPEWGMEPPRLSPQMSHEDEHNEEPDITQAVQETVADLVTLVTVASQEALQKEHVKEETRDEQPEHVVIAETPQHVVNAETPRSQEVIVRIEDYETRGEDIFFSVKLRGEKKRRWISETELKGDANAKKMIDRMVDRYKKTNTVPAVTRRAAANQGERTKAASESEQLEENIVEETKPPPTPKSAVSEGGGPSEVRRKKHKKKIRQEHSNKKRHHESTSTPIHKEENEVKQQEGKSPKKHKLKKLKIKPIRKSPDELNEDVHVLSDDADELPKVRPSRHRRKPNWINDSNYVTAFQKKRPRPDVASEVDGEVVEGCAGDRPGSTASVTSTTSVGTMEHQQSDSRNCSQQSDRSSKSNNTCISPKRSLSSTPKKTRAKNTSLRLSQPIRPSESAAHQAIVPSPSVTQPMDTDATVVLPETSTEQKASCEIVLPLDEKSLILTGLEDKKQRVHRSASPTVRSNSTSCNGSRSVVSDQAMVPPPVFVAPARRCYSEYSSNKAVPKSLKKDKEMSRYMYTPRARKLKFGEDDLHTEFEEDHDENTASGSGTAVHSRRKQNLSKIHESDDITIVRLANGRTPPRPQDLSEIPVYLTELQRELFFSFIRPASTSTDGEQKCMQCGRILANMMEGRRHAVSHLRIMRLRCSLCDCGSFFCTDMRVHLQYRHCPKLQLAPKDYVLPGDSVPCMGERQADDLIKLVDPQKPGRVLYTSGKIVSRNNPVPYYPDSEIEQRILGSLQPEHSDRTSVPSGRKVDDTRADS